MLPSLHATVLMPHVLPANALWAAIDTSNQTLAAQLRRLSALHRQHGEMYASAVTYMAGLPSSEVSALFSTVA